MRSGFGIRTSERETRNSIYLDFFLFFFFFVPFFSTVRHWSAAAAACGQAERNVRATERLSGGFESRARFGPVGLTWSRSTVTISSRRRHPFRRRIVCVRVGRVFRTSLLPGQRVPSLPYAVSRFTVCATSGSYRLRAVPKTAIVSIKINDNLTTTKITGEQKKTKKIT